MRANVFDVGKALFDLEEAFRDYPKPRLEAFLKASAFDRADDEPVRWAADFLARDVRPNDANEADTLYLYLSPVGFAYFFPIWIRETLNGNWGAGTNIYGSSQWILNRREWRALSSAMTSTYSRNQKDALAQTMFAASSLHHFDDTAKKLRAHAQALLES